MSTIAYSPSPRQRLDPTESVRAQSDAVPFEDLFLSHGPIDRYTLVGIFLAVLELVKLGALGVTQEAESPDSIQACLRVPDLVESLEALAEHQSMAEALPEATETEDTKPSGEAGCESP